MSDYIREVVFSALDRFQPTIFHNAEDVALLLIDEIDVLEKANIQSVTLYVQEYLNNL
jgi:hypothetical protein